MELFGDTMAVGVKRESRLGSRLERTKAKSVRSHRESNGARFGNVFIFVVSFGITFVLLNVILSLVHLPDLASQVLVLVLPLTVAGVVATRTELALRVVCVVLAFVGIILTVTSLYVENVSELRFNTGLLGAGTSIMAIAIAVYALLLQRTTDKDAVAKNKNGRRVRNSEEGYVWIERIKKFRCEYCRSSNAYRYHRTLSGAKRHIAKEHG